MVLIIILRSLFPYDTKKSTLNAAGRYTTLWSRITITGWLGTTSDSPWFSPSLRAGLSSSPRRPPAVASLAGPARQACTLEARKKYSRSRRTCIPERRGEEEGTQTIRRGAALDNFADVRKKPTLRHNWRLVKEIAQVTRSWMVAVIRLMFTFCLREAADMQKIYHTLKLSICHKGK